MTARPVINELYAYVYTDDEGRELVYRIKIDPSDPITPMVFTDEAQARRVERKVRYDAQEWGCEIRLMRFASPELIDTFRM